MGSSEADLIQVAELIYKGKYVIAPSVFTCTQYDALVKELQRELSKHLTWTGLQGERGLAEVSFRAQRCSWGPEKEELGAELDLPVELVHFLAEGEPTPTKSPQHSLASVGEAQLKILTAAASSQSSSQSCTRTGRERADPVRYPH